MDGAALRRIRDQLGITQAALAQRLGVTANTVARWGRDEIPIREPMARLIQLLAPSRAIRRSKK